jgi:hypothetical protein
MILTEFADELIGCGNARPVVVGEATSPSQPVVMGEATSPSQPVVMDEATSPSQPVVVGELTSPSQSGTRDLVHYRKFFSAARLSTRTVGILGSEILVMSDAVNFYCTMI